MTVVVTVVMVVVGCVVVVQVVANPLISLLGPAKTVHSRLTFAQAFNSLGTTIFPRVGSALILGSLAGVSAAQLSGPALDAYRESYDEIDIYTSADLQARFGEEIPVTFVDGAQHDFWRVDADRLRAALMA